MTLKRRFALAIAATVLPVALAAAPGTADALTAARATQPAHPPVPAARTITLTAADNGRRIRLHRGENVLVQLRVNLRESPDPTTWWRAIGEAGRALKVRPQTAISIRGTTRGHYQAVARGRAVLSSSRSVCPQRADGPTCHSMQGWNVTIDVR
jgi:hypothetical protein